MDVQARTCLAHGNLGGKSHVQPHLVCQVADDPLGQRQLVGGLLGRHGQELNLVLLIDGAVLHKVAHLAVAILDLAAGLGDILHALGAELATLGIRTALMIASLVLGREHLVVIEDNIVLQLAHCVEFHTSHLLERFAGLVQSVLGAALQRIAVLVEVTAQQAQCRNLGKWVDKGGAVARQHIQVAAASLDEREQT